MNSPEAARVPLPVVSLEHAARALREGGVVVYPTETFFGLGCVACHAEAVDRVYAVKRRAAQLPLPVLGADRAQLERVAVFSPAVEELARRFWPGPLTLLLPALPCVPERITAGTGTIAVRVTSHPTASALAAAVGEALAASSANISGRPPVNQACALDAELWSGSGDTADGVLVEGPAPDGGLPSTLAQILPPTSPLKSTTPSLRILRVGAVSCAALEAAGFSLQLPE